MTINFPEVKTQPTPGMMKRLHQLAYEQSVKRAGKDAIGA